MEEARIDEIADQVLGRRKLTGMGDLRIESSVIEPVVKSQNFCRFEVPRGKGILDSDTAVQLSVKNNDTTSTGSRAYLNTLQGIKGLINKAVLRIGGKVIATSEEFHFLSATLAGHTPADDKECISHNIEGSQFYWRNLTQLQESTSPAAPNLFINGSVMVGGNHFENAAGVGDQLNFLVDEHILPDSTDASTPKFMVRLHELFPFLKSNQLPLFTMPDQSVFVELYFNNPTTPAPVCQNVGGASAITIVEDDLKLFATYQFFADEVMNRIQNRYDTQGLSFIYEDYQYVRKGLPASANAADEQELVADIGGQNKVIRDILIHKQTYVQTEIVPGYSHYRCNGLYERTSTVDVEESYQFEINDQLLFPRPINEPAALLYYYSTAGDNGDAWIPKPVQSYEAGILGNGSLTGDATGANGCFFEGSSGGAFAGSYAPRAITFRKDRSNSAGNGKLVGSKPVRMIYRRKGAAAGDQGSDSQLSFRIWLVVERGFVLKDGEVAVSG
tara:strand:+ start:4933 stop:6438 length:1506 start_codon:yes stop_codon:yes gene_type:complete